MSSQHGQALGRVAWQELLAVDTDLIKWMRTSNHATVISQNNNAASSAYAIGLFESNERQCLFGASITLRFDLEKSGKALLNEVRIQVNWFKGDPSLATHWLYLPEDAG